MTLVRPFREWSLGAKLATTFLVVVAGVATLVGVAVIRHERTALDSELRKRGINLAEHLSRLSRDLVLQDDLWGLYKVVRDTAAMLASASPRKPSVVTCSKSSTADTLLVAWRENAQTASSADIPSPSSTTAIRSTPAPSSSTRIFLAPASREFSISSFTTEAGRSTTSPAAILFATSGGSTRIRRPSPGVRE